MRIKICLLISFFVSWVSAEDSMFVFNYPVSVTISPKENACSILNLTFHVLEYDKPVYLDSGTTGLDSDFLHSVLTLNGDSVTGMYFGNLVSKSSANTERSIQLYFDKSPYSSEFDIKKWFPNSKGEFYIDYSYYYEPEWIGDLQIVENKQTSIFRIDKVSSDRYYMKINDRGCIEKFFEAKKK
jgi:hypothetical protein